MGSDKTIIGTNDATLNGKGLVFDGTTNVIIQNIKIENLNPRKWPYLRLPLFLVHCLSFSFFSLFFHP